MYKQTLCFIRRNDEILMLNRERKPTLGIWNGVGGKIEENETPLECGIREVKEETGLDITDVRLCGVKQFMHRDGLYRYIVFLFKTNQYSGELKSSDEGEVFWIEREDLAKYKQVDGFEHMLEIFENDNLSENYWWREDGELKVENK